jgi:hypothetical protein
MNLIVFLLFACIATTANAITTGPSMWAPPGSKGVTNADGSITVIPPVEWRYVGATADGEVVFASSATIRCECSSPKGASCRPFFVDTGEGIWGCMQDGCSSCTGHAMVNNREVERGGFVNIGDREPVAFAAPGEELPMAFPAMLEVPEFKAEVRKFINKNFGTYTLPAADMGSGDAPKGFVWVPMKMFGRMAVILAPNTNTDLAVGIMASKPSCSGCTSRQCQLTSQGGTFIPEVSICEPACSEGCTLRNTVTTKDGGTFTIESKSYQW